jgi:hypothetical protein
LRLSFCFWIRLGMSQTTLHALYQQPSNNQLKDAELQRFKNKVNAMIQYGSKAT